MKKRILQFWKHYPQQCIFALLVLCVSFFCCHDAFLYSSPIAKVTAVKTTREDTATNYNNGDYQVSENTYSQIVHLRILNGSSRGKTISTANDFSSSQVDTVRYHRGDQVFVSLSGSGTDLSCSITGVKRDSYAVILLLLFVYLLLVVTGKRGIPVLITIVVNIAVFSFALYLYHKGQNILTLSYGLIIFFTIFTLLLANGINRRTLVAIFSSFATLFVTLTVFQLVMRFGTEIDYAALDYITGDQDLESIFMAGISLAGLGAVMDVAVTISSSLCELRQKTPGISLRQMVTSGREIGHDIMGTMIDVLLFTYLCGLLPLIIIKVRNEISYLTIIRLQIPFEICRFLMGGIEILMAIPISIGFASLFFRDRRQKA